MTQRKRIALRPLQLGWELELIPQLHLASELVQRLAALWTNGEVGDTESVTGMAGRTGRISFATSCELLTLQLRVRRLKIVVKTVETCAVMLQQKGDCVLQYTQLVMSHERLQQSKLRHVTGVQCLTWRGPEEQGVMPPSKMLEALLSSAFLLLLLKLSVHECYGLPCSGSCCPYVAR
eukprot:2129791-Amphidinium_carterae.1